MIDPTRTALGLWSGGKFMHFGAQLEHDRLVELLRPDAQIQTLITADAYGAGEADTLAGEALAGLSRDDYCLVGAIGHDSTKANAKAPKASRASLILATPTRQLRGLHPHGDRAQPRARWRRQL